MTQFFVQPRDAVWLRSAEPFAAGESSSTGAVFPPSPWTWQGMVRARLVQGHWPQEIPSRPEVERKVGPPDGLPKSWQIGGPFPARRTNDGKLQLWFPWPAFLGLRDDQPVRSKPYSPADHHLASHPPAAQLPGGARRVEQGWIAAEGLLWALLDRCTWSQEWAATPGKTRTGASGLPPFVHAERRAGLAIDPATGRAQDHLLYTATEHRFEEGSGLWGVLDHGGDTWPAKHLTTGTVNLGRRARAGVLAKGGLPEACRLLIKGGVVNRPPATGDCCLRVVLLSPALRLPGEEAPFDLSPTTSLLGREAFAGPEIGGYDTVNQRTRPLQSTWAAGSTFLLGMNARGSQQAAERLLQRGSSRGEPFGFGQRIGVFIDPKTGLPHA